MTLLKRGIQVLQSEGLTAFANLALKRFLHLLHIKIPPQEITGFTTLLSDEDYQRWITENEPNSEQILQEAQLTERQLYQPLISIIIPVYNPELFVLKQALTSIKSQTYSNWEICIADGSTTRGEAQDWLFQFSIQDDRIRLKLLDENLGISGNSNEAIQLATGEYIAFLDQDDLLAPNALDEIVRALNQDPTLDILYSDHDLLEYNGSKRKQPLFKPAWSPEILLSANFITHLTVIRTSLVTEVQGFNSEFDGAQDWDLFLRVSERTQHIRHIPKILYHWRESRESTAGNIWSKEYAPPAQLKAISAHLKRQGLADAEAFFDPSGYIRVRWSYDRSKKVSIIIPTYGANPMLERCVHSILNKTEYPNYEILIVNNGARKPDQFPFFQKIQTMKNVHVIHDERTFNYSAVNNFGARNASGEILLFLNNDTEILSPDWLDELVMWIERDDIGIVGAKLLQADGTIQHAGVIIGLSGFAGHIFAGQPEYEWTIFGLAEWYRNYHAVTAACMIIRRQVFEEIGGFDDAFILCGNDVEICLRVARTGRRIVYNPFARVRHLESATRGSEVPFQDYQISFRHYLPVLQTGDEYFHPALSYWHLRPTLAKPGETSPLEFVEQYLEQLKGTSNIEDHH